MVGRRVGVGWFNVTPLSPLALYRGPGVERNAYVCDVWAAIMQQEEMKVALDHPPRLEAVKKGVVMQPVDIVKRIMAIREALAKEWLEDLVNVQVARAKKRRNNLGGEPIDPSLEKTRRRLRRAVVVEGIKAWRRQKCT